MNWWDAALIATAAAAAAVVHTDLAIACVRNGSHSGIDEACSILSENCELSLLICSHQTEDA